VVQYYRDLWEKLSEMLAPLTNLLGECGYSKLDKAQRKKENTLALKHGTSKSI
jgi:hypothetical protein